MKFEEALKAMKCGNVEVKSNYHHGEDTGAGIQRKKQSSCAPKMDRN